MSPFSLSEPLVQDRLVDSKCGPLPLWIITKLIQTIQHLHCTIIHVRVLATLDPSPSMGIRPSIGIGPSAGIWVQY